MSIRVMDRVIHSRIGEFVARSRPPGQKQDVSDPLIKFVLYKMADWGADDGTSIYPSVPLISALTEMSERSVQRALADLMQAGLLILVKEGGGTRANEYRINLEKLLQLDMFTETTHRKPVKKAAPADVGDIGVVETVDKPVDKQWCQSGTGVSTTGEGCHTDTSTGANQAPLTTNINHQLTTTNDGGVEKFFEKMFKAYPKQLDEDGAREAFEVAVGKGADPQQLADAAAAYATQVAREGKDERFIPYPANWLSKGLYKPVLEALERAEKAAARSLAENGPVPHWANHPMIDDAARLWLRGAVYEGKSPLGDKAIIKVPRRGQRDYIRTHYTCDLQVVFKVPNVEIELMEAQ